MNSANSPLILPLFFFLFLIISSFQEAPFRAVAQQTKETQNGNGLERRVLMSFKERPSGSNLTFDCTPSGPCVPCLYSEKGDEKYRCSETGYRIPFKCVEIKDSVKDTKKKNSQQARSSLEISDNIAKSHKLSHVSLDVTTQSQRSLLDDSSPSDNRSQAYITYRSCIPPATEEKLSVLGFEGVVIFLLLISGSFIYLKKKKAVSVSGFAAGRAQTTNSRF